METRASENGLLKSQDLKMYIGGKWVASAAGRRFDSLNPYTQKVWATVPDASADDVGAAVGAAREAFDKGSWRKTTPQQRAALLRRLGDLMARDAGRIARIESADNGKLLREVTNQAKYLSEWLYYFAGLATQACGEVLPSDRPDFFAFTRKEPIGVVAAITPWNAPCLLMVMKLAPALAAGCTFVVKPSEHTPVSTLVFAELVEEAGFPPGVFNVVTGGPEAGRALVSDARVDRISFTGSDANGKSIAAAGAGHLARVTLELGGKSPQLVFADCDLEATAAGVAFGIFGGTGQTCLAGSRLIVERTIHDQLLDRLVARARNLKLGDPLDPATEMGPAATEPQFRKILAMIETARAEGATIAYGGEPAPEGGFFVKPTILTDVRQDMAIAQEEVFGPILSVLPFDSEEEAIAIANDSRYGLAAGVWTENLKLAHRVISELRAGTVWVNAYKVTAPYGPFGGFKMSGIGRENGRDGMNEYLETKTVWIKTR